MTVRDFIITLTGQTLVSVHDIFNANQEASEVITNTPALLQEKFVKYADRTVVIFEPSSSHHINVYI